MELKQLSEIFAEQEQAFSRFWAEPQDILLKIAQALVDGISKGGKILLFGNGGSAADAQHVAAEIVGRYTRERRGFPALALTTDTSVLTAVANDYGFETVFTRQVEALANPGDLVVGISTSGNSPNILNALLWAKQHGLKSIGFTGRDGGKMPLICDLCFIAPSAVTARIQEIHISAWHAVCDLLEEALLRKEP